jgi:hypothetical protein
LGVVGFIAALASRAAVGHFGRATSGWPTRSLLTTAFALPFALVQPILQPVGDMVNSTRMIACLVVTILPCGERLRPVSPC